jgi:DNA-binding transcriptional ArsR family regulator
MYQINGLKGAPRIVLTDIMRLLAAGDDVSVDRLCDTTGYARTTVIRALAYLREQGLLEMDYENGKRANYQIVEEGAVKLSDILRATINLVALDGPEWFERMQMALVAHQIYNDAKHLRKLSRQVGGRFAQRCGDWLSQNRVLSLTQVWELDEAYEIRDRVRDLIDQAEELVLQ